MPRSKPPSPSPTPAPAAAPAAAPATTAAAAAATVAAAAPICLPLAEAHALLMSVKDFMTVSIHTILYYRHIYPPHTFLSSRAYNLPVHQNRHPKVCAWIRDAADAVWAQLATGTAERVAVVINAPPPPPPSGRQAGVGVAGGAAGAVLERWLFDVSHFPAWPGGAEAMRAFGNEDESEDGGDDERKEEGGAGEKEGGEGEGEETGAGAGAEEVEADDEEEEEDEEEETDEEDGDEGDGSAVNWTDVDEQLRGMVKRIAHMGERLGPLPDGCTFTMAIELCDDGELPIGHPQPWIPSEPNLQRTVSKTSSKTSKPRRRNGRDIGGATTTPVRSMEVGPLFMECWVEEGIAKSIVPPPGS